MTFNGAFPSSPLSRSALRGEAERSPSILATEGRSVSDQLAPGLFGQCHNQSPLGRRISEGNNNVISSAGHLSSQLNKYRQGSYIHTSPGAQSTTPPMTPPLQSSNSTYHNNSLATSPLLYQRRSPGSRSTPLISNRRRYSEQSPSSSIPHHSPGPNFGSFVGSYEESLLSGRMSSLPSKPLMFDAELGVLGLGKCKASLRCPPHVNIPFPAHFYNLDQSSVKEGSTAPGTPYVGTIDLEAYYLDQILSSRLDTLDFSRDISRSSIRENHEDSRSISSGSFHHQSAPIKDDLPQFPGYKIPPKGQIQLVIKNPNLTAVKLFLVPYDFTDMPAGSKTFIRQKSHAAPPGSANDIAKCPSPTPPRGQSRPSSTRETLRYAIHLQFCAVSTKVCSKSRQSEPGLHTGMSDRIQQRRTSDDTDFKTRKSTTSIYLHKNIRVVFAARVPDSTEKLRIVTEMPSGSEVNSLDIYSTYLGPSDEWKEAKKVAKEIKMAALRDHDGLTNIQTRAEAEAVNDDPNGERWFASSTPEEEAVASSLTGMDIPLTSRSPWRENEVNSSLQVKGSEDMANRSSAPVNTAGFPTAAFNDNKVTHVSKVVRRSASPDERSGSEDGRLLLDQWHASIASRSQATRPTSPSHRVKPTSPTTVKTPTSPTNVGRLYTLMNRSTSSQGIAQNTSQESILVGGMTGDIPASTPLRVSPYRNLALRPLTPQRTGDGMGMPHNALTIARPVQASLDLDHANGVLEAQSSSPLLDDISDSTSPASFSQPPSLLRRLSSQSQLAK